MSVTLHTDPDCPDCARVRAWLVANGVEHRELSAAASPETVRLAAEAGYGQPAYPLVETDAGRIVRPSDRELALFLGRELPPVNEVDCLIIGGGPAGLTAALYLARERVSTVVLEKATPGGQVNTTSLVENYPGFPQGVDGPDLMVKLTYQARRFGAEVLFPMEVSALREAPGGGHEVSAGGRVWRAPALIAAPGSDYRRLAAPGAAELIGRGVGYCATCDAPFFRNKTVAVVGGGNSAAEESLFLLRFVKELHLFQNLPELTAQRHLADKLAADPRVHINLNSEVTAVRGDPGSGVRSVAVRDRASGQEREVAVQGVFVFIGRTPNTGWLRGYVELDKAGFVVTRPGSVETSRPGFFAAGDCRSGARAQITTAAGDGTMASFLVRELLRERES
ncbi:MAG TPA: FAD-dependent oxidoreductase [Planctomycetota bacterium]|nr:FAD-dependent oxidoreductase [Planctomycetota bacterium]